MEYGGTPVGLSVIGTAVGAPWHLHAVTTPIAGDEEGVDAA